MPRKALYDWDHARQLLHVRVAERGGEVRTADLYAPEFLIEMPLLKALRNAGRTVLLIDEIDRADDAFEAFLLEFLSDYPDLDPRDRHGPRQPAGHHHPDLQPHARTARRAAPPLPLSLDRLSRAGPRARHHRAACAGHRGGSRRAAGRRRRGDPPAAADQAAGHRREHRLGARGRSAAPRRRAVAGRAEALARPDRQGPGGFRRGRGGRADLSAAPAGIAARRARPICWPAFPARLREAGLAVDPGRAAAFLAGRPRRADAQPRRSVARRPRDAGRLARRPRDLRRGFQGLVCRRRAAANRGIARRGTGAAREAARRTAGAARHARRRRRRQGRVRRPTSCNRRKSSAAQSEADRAVLGAHQARPRPAADDREPHAPALPARRAASTSRAPRARRAAPPARRCGCFARRGPTSRAGCCCWSTSPAR